MLLFVETLLPNMQFNPAMNALNVFFVAPHVTKNIKHMNNNKSLPIYDVNVFLGCYIIFAGNSQDTRPC